MFENLRELLTAQPFSHFRIHMNNGRYFDVRHPEFMGIGRNTVFASVPT